MSYDLDDADVMPSEAPSGMNESGILHKIKYKGCALVSFESKTTAGKKSTAAEFNFEDETGKQHRELIFKPHTDPTKITWAMDKYEKDAQNKYVKTRKMTPQEMVKVLSNDILYFLIDLAEALGYTNPKEVIVKLAKQGNDDDAFDKIIEGFKTHFPPSERKLISMKLLWENNKKNKTSFLKLRTGPTIYYPFMGDIFDAYVPDRPTSLFINDYEAKNKMKRQYQPGDNAPASAQAATESGSAPNGQQKWKGIPGGDMGSGTPAAAPGSDEEWV